MLKKGQPVKFSRPVSTMKTVFEAIEQGHVYRQEIVTITKLEQGKVRSALFNLCFVGAVRLVQDKEGRSMYALPGAWLQPTPRILCGINSIFNCR